jgi:thioesterase domain-containing protein
VHPNAGRLRSFVDLARHLGSDQPFYGLQTLAPQPTVEAMAAQNIEAMRSVQPHGPYVLSGYSFGGIVAFEMARQLESQGEPLALLALLDSAPMHRDARVQDVPDESVFRTWFAWELGRVGMTRGSGSDVGFEDASGIFELFKANMEALWRYVPGHYPGRLTLFKARESVGDDLLSTLPTHLAHVLTAQLSDTAYGWGALVSERPHVHSVPGDHYSMLAQPHVEVVAAQLQRAIAEALSEQTEATDPSLLRS